MTRRRRKGSKRPGRPKRIPASAITVIEANAPEGDSELPSIDEAAERLGPFFEVNPYSTVERSDENPALLQIVKPWGDSSVALNIETGFNSLADALNALVLPERLSAIWHRDIRKLEIIWTAFRLPPIWEEVFGRKFVFEHAANRHVCEFGLSSDRLMVLAEHFGAEGAQKPATAICFRSGH